MSNSWDECEAAGLRFAEAADNAMAEYHSELDAIDGLADYAALMVLDLTVDFDQSRAIATLKFVAAACYAAGIKAASGSPNGEGSLGPLPIDWQ